MQNYTLLPLLSLLALLSLWQPVYAERLQQNALKQTHPEKALLLSLAKAGDRIVAVGEQGLIVYSDNQGNKWHQADVPVSNMLTAVHFFDKEIGWAVGHDGVVLKSLDGGLTWRKLLDGEQTNRIRVASLQQHFDSVSQQSPQSELLESLEYQLDDALLAQEDGPSAPLLDVLFIDQNRGFAVGAYGLLLRTEDGGEQWHYEGHKLDNPDSLHLNSLFLTQQGQLYLVGEAGLIFVSQDQGRGWQRLETPYEGSFFSVAESDRLFLLGLRGNIFAAQEQAGAPALLWQRLEIGVTATLNAAALFADKLYLVGQGGAILKQSEQGFIPFGQRGLRSYSDVIAVPDGLILVGEAGVELLALAQQKEVGHE